MEIRRVLTRVARALVALGLLTLVGVLIYCWLWPKTMWENDIPVGFRVVDPLVVGLGLTGGAWCVVAAAAVRVIRDSLTWQRTLVGLAQVVGVGVVVSGPLSSEVGTPNDSRPWMVLIGGLVVIVVAKVVGYVTLGPKHAFVPLEQGNAMADPPIVPAPGDSYSATAPTDGGFNVLTASAFAPAPASPEDPAPESPAPRRF